MKLEIVMEPKGDYVLREVTTREVIENVESLCDRGDI